MKYLTFLLTILIASNTAIAADINSISESLGWESKWNKITNYSISSYVERTKADQMEGLTENKKVQASKEIFDQLVLLLNWDNSGDLFINNISTACDLNILNNIVNIQKGTLSEVVDNGKVVTDYRACMRTALKNSMPILTKIILSFKSDKDKIIEKYKSL